MKQLVILLIILSAAACKKGKSPQPVLPPTKAILLLPATNEACTQGRVISTSQSAITFKWNTAGNAESYELTIKNLLSGALTTKPSASNQLEVTLDRNVPYSWYVVSKAAGTTETSKSDTWKFYNSGEANISYAPFPADNLIPAMRQAMVPVGGKINLSWEAQDVDNDIIGYDVYLGTSNSNPPLLQANVALKKMDGVSVVANTTYYWKVVAKDSKGNSSDSGIYIFSVN